VLGRCAQPHTGGDRTELLFHSVTVDAPPAAAWKLVLDADLYARLAPNLSAISVAADQCSRACTDTRGNTWSEAMRLDHDRHVQRIDVDVTEHPMPLDGLAATISVHDDRKPVGSTGTVDALGQATGRRDRRDREVEHRLLPLRNASRRDRAPRSDLY
jgi:hypothetical protein